MAKNPNETGGEGNKRLDDGVVEDKDRAKKDYVNPGDKTQPKKS